MPFNGGLILQPWNNQVSLKPFKDLEIANPEIEYKAEINKIENKIYVTLKCKNFAKGVNLTCNIKENFSDNIFQS